MSLIDINGELLTKDKKRRRQVSTMKKTLPQGDVLFKLIVDLPEGVSVDDFNRVMTEYFGIGYESFKGKL